MFTLAFLFNTEEAAASSPEKWPRCSSPTWILKLTPRRSPCACIQSRMKLPIWYSTSPTSHPGQYSGTSLRGTDNNCFFPPPSNGHTPLWSVLFPSLDDWRSHHSEDLYIQVLLCSKIQPPSSCSPTLSWF